MLDKHIYNFWTNLIIIQIRTMIISNENFKRQKNIYSIRDTANTRVYTGEVKIPVSSRSLPGAMELPL